MTLSPEHLRILHEANSQREPLREDAVWSGPCRDGVTFSLLSRWLSCRERFRLLVVEGLKPADKFNHRIEYGSMWHVCEESHAAGESHEVRLGEYCRHLAKRYPLSQEEVLHWYGVCVVQFPVYVDYWSRHPDTVARVPFLQEESFDVMYPLPSGRIVRLRGKYDSVDRVVGNLVLQENKTKGDIDEVQIQRNLHMDLQTMLYLVALRRSYPEKKIGGVRYNVVRRPLSGGAGSIRQHKPSKSNPRGETKREFYDRLRGIIEESPETYFMRWDVPVTTSDMDLFQRHCLDPMLEALCNWWEQVELNPRNPWVNNHLGLHWRHPYGVANPIDEYGATELDEFLRNGNEVGLQRVEELFPELEAK